MNPMNRRNWLKAMGALGAMGGMGILPSAPAEQPAVAPVGESSGFTSSVLDPHKVQDTQFTAKL
nr:hypothetical protein [Thermogutta sp.]